LITVRHEVNDEKFFGPEWDLANIAANTVWGDGFLADLIDLAETGIGSLIGVFTNGMIVMGAVATAERIAQELDRQREMGSKTAERPDEVSPEDWDERMKLWATRNQRAYEAAVQEREEVEERLQSADEPRWDYSAQPKGLPREVLESQLRTTLTLTNVQIIAPGQPGILRLSALRIALKQIAGWWPLPVDEEGKASFQLFTIEDE
jgi:hypothetical protein